MLAPGADDRAPSPGPPVAAGGADGGIDVGELLAATTPEERVGLLAGADLWHTAAVPRLGVPALRLTDGPNGARGTRFGGVPSACFPCGTALAAAWDPGLVAEVGAALGREARAKGARVLLAPTLNLHRTPLGGRNFEGFSEDPHLAARTAVAYVGGVQSQRVACCAKHYVANDTEFERTTISSEVDERTLRELYLVPFEAAVREAGARAVMAAYNRVNGTYASEHAGLLAGVLRGEWGFDGLVMSDWYGLRSTAEALEAGCDLEMPGPPTYRGDRLLVAVREGRVGEEAVAASARRVLGLAAWAGAFADGEPGPERADDDPAVRALVRRAAAEGTVLLRNEGSFLPLDPARLTTVAVVGPNAEVGQVQGGGSAGVRPHRVVGPLEAIRARIPDVRFAPGVVTAKTTPAVDRRRATTPAGAPGLLVEYRPDGDDGGEPVAAHVADQLRFVWMGPPADGVDPTSFSLRASATFTPDESGSWTWGLTSVGPSRLWLDDELVLDNSEGRRGDAFFGFGSAEATATVAMEAGRARRLRVEYRRRPGAPLAGLVVGCSPPVPDDLLERAVAAATGADAAVVVVGTNDDWESEGADREALGLPGRQDELVRRVAAANPNTVVVVNAGSPVALPWADDVRAVLQVWFPGQELGSALADVLFGDAEPGGRLPTTIPVRLEDTPAFSSHPGEGGLARYAEGLFVGYRWYDARRIEPRYPFGHGLGYTTFAYGPLAVSGDPDAGGLVASVDVTNTGPRPGAEVVQLYVHPVAPRRRRPDQELRAYAKVRLSPGETRAVRLVLDRRAFSCWDPSAAAWVADPGPYELRAGRSSRDVRSTAEWTLEA